MWKLFKKITFTALLTFFFCHFCGGLFASDDWPMFKNDVEHSAVQPADIVYPPLALKWSGDVTIGAIDTVAYSSPIMWNGKTYIGSMSGSLLAFNGNISGNSNMPFGTFKTDGFIYGSAAVTTIGTQDLAFIGSTDGYLYCFKVATNGLALLWKEDLGGPIFTSPLIVSEGSGTNTTNVVLCASHSGTLTAFTFNATSHSPYWSTDISTSYLFASPAYKKGPADKLHFNTDRSSMSWTDDIHEELHEMDAQGLRRRLRAVDLLGGMRASVENKDCILFCTNNYLGLADHPHVLKRSSKTILH